MVSDKVSGANLSLKSTLYGDYNCEMDASVSCDFKVCNRWCVSEHGSVNLRFLSKIWIMQLFMNCVLKRFEVNHAVV